MEAVRWRLSLVATPYYLLWLRCQDTEYDGHRLHLAGGGRLRKHPMKKLFVFASLTEEEAAALGDLLDVVPATSPLRHKLVPSPVPPLPPTALLLHDEHVAYRIILLLDNPTSDEMRVLEQSLMERYGQQLSAVGLAAAQSVAALDRLVRAANADD